MLYLIPGDVRSIVVVLLVEQQRLAPAIWIAKQVGTVTVQVAQGGFEDETCAHKERGKRTHNLRCLGVEIVVWDAIRRTTALASSSHTDTTYAWIKVEID